MNYSLSITNSQSSPKLMSIESVMPSNHLILFCLLFLLPLIFPSIGVFSNESAFRIRWPKYQSFSFNISPSNDSRLISFRMDWLDLPAVQGTLKSLLQHHSSKASVLLHSAFFIVQFSHPHMTTGKTLMVFYRLGPGGTGIKKKERKRERKSKIPWVTWKANKAHTQDLYHSRRHRASSQGGLESNTPVIFALYCCLGASH